MELTEPIMRATRFIQYAVYVAAVSLLNSFIIMVAATLLASGEGLRGSRDTMMFLPRAWMIVPYVVLQLVIAVLAIKALSLRKLFVLSAVFLLAVNLLQAVPSPLQVVNWIWIVGMFWGITYNPVGLLAPVLLLALIQRRRVNDTPVLPSISEAVGVPDAALPQSSVDRQRVMRRWYYWDVGLSALLMWFGAIIDPWGILSYLGGLMNVPFVLIARGFFVMLFPVVPICLLALPVRMVAIWPRHICGWRLLRAWGVSIMAFVLLFVMPFMVRPLTPRKAFMAGFTRYIQRIVDFPEAQGWLATLEPAEPLHSGQWHPPFDVEWSNLPLSVARLKAWGMDVTLDDMGRPMIRLMWGSGIMGSWGLVVGDKEMETPPSDFSQYGEVRETAAPGAYIWYSLD